MQESATSVNRPTGQHHLSRTDQNSGYTMHINTASPSSDRWSCLSEVPISNTLSRLATYWEEASGEHYPFEIGIAVVPSGTQLPGPLAETPTTTNRTRTRAHLRQAKLPPPIKRRREHGRRFVNVSAPSSQVPRKARVVQLHPEGFSSTQREGFSHLRHTLRFLRCDGLPLL